MNLLQACSPNVVTARRSTTIIDVARLMHDHHVGAVVVMDEGVPPRPVGIVTDRDIVLRVVALAQEKIVTLAEQAMSTELVMVPGSTGIQEAVQLMRERGVRRLLVTGEEEFLKGIVSFDDLVAVLADQMGSMAQTIATGMLREEKRRVPARWGRGHSASST